MPESPILGLPQVAPSQNQKENVVNSAVAMLEAALNDSTRYDMSFGDVTMLTRDMTGYFLHIADGHIVPQTLNVPARKRIFAVQNAGTANLTVAMGGSSLTIPKGMVFLIHSSGSALTKLGSNNSILAFINLTDAPASYAGQALKYARVKADETGMDFVTSASVVSGLSDYETEYTTTSPTTPASGLELFTRKRSGFNRPATKNAAGLIDELQFSLHSKNLAFVQANGSAGGSPIGTDVFGFNAATAGTLAPTTLDFTTYMKSVRRTKMTTDTSAGSLAALYTANTWLRRGSGGDPAGGFFFSCRFGLETYTANMAAAVGIWDVAAPIGTTDPSAQLTGHSGIILYKNASDTNWKLGRAAGAAVTTLDLGATYPTNTSATDFYEMRLFCPQAGGDVYYSLHRLNTGDITEGSFSTVLPTTALMSPMIMTSNRALTSAVSMAFSNLYVTTDQ